MSGEFDVGCNNEDCQWEGLSSLCKDRERNNGNIALLCPHCGQECEPVEFDGPLVDGLTVGDLADKLF